MNDLDREIDLARERLHALYRQRRELRAALKSPKRKRLAWGETFQRAMSEPLTDIAREFNITLRTVRDRLYQDIYAKCTSSTSSDDWEAHYRKCIWLNNTLPQHNRLHWRRLWPWSTSIHDGKKWNDPAWSDGLDAHS